MGESRPGVGRLLSMLAVGVLVTLALCAFMAGVLAKYVSTAADKTVTVSVVNQWSSDAAGQVFPVDVYVRAYVTAGGMKTDDAGELRHRRPCYDERPCARGSLFVEDA